jgi:hypothetical protein
MLTFDRGIKQNRLPPHLVTACTDFAHALATAQAGPTSASLLQYFRSDAFFMPHNHDRPQAGLGSLRTYWRRHASLFHGALIRLQEIKRSRATTAAVRFELQMKSGVLLHGIVHLREEPESEQWLISHLWLRQETETNRPTQSQKTLKKTKHEVQQVA